jgi:hypothetical protein
VGRILLAVLVLWAVVAGCGQPSSPTERQEKREGVEQAEDFSAAEATDPPKESGISQEEFVENQQKRVVEIEPPTGDVPEYEVFGEKPHPDTSSKDKYFMVYTKENGGR